MVAVSFGLMKTEQTGAVGQVILQLQQILRRCFRRNHTAEYSRLVPDRGPHLRHQPPARHVVWDRGASDFGKNPSWPKRYICTLAVGGVRSLMSEKWLFSLLCN
jgi:hypothetical protein